MTDYTKGVIHTTMHMPSSCSMCWINKSCEEHAKEWKKPWKGYDQRLDTCPLQPVRHGRWIETSYDEYQCSVCGKNVKDEIIFMLDIDDREHILNGVANYCPNCGAKMDKEKDGE